MSCQNLTSRGAERFDRFEKITFDGNRVHAWQQHGKWLKDVNYNQVPILLEVAHGKVEWHECVNQGFCASVEVNMHSRVSDDRPSLLVVFISVVSCCSTLVLVPRS